MNMMGGKIATLVLVSTLCSAFASHEADELHGRRIAFSNSLVVFGETRFSCMLHMLFVPSASESESESLPIRVWPR